VTSGHPLIDLRVLVVEDDDDSRFLYELVLTEAGAEVRAASNASEAMQMILLWPPSIIVSDLSLPGTDGLTLLREIRSKYDLRIPAICVSGQAGGEARAAALAAGFQEYAGKPLEPDELVALVKRCAESA
jgi:CheY-like chemotaxis protein